jgi:hypothetical protein
MEEKMRYLCIYKPSKAEGQPPTEEEMAAMGKFIDEVSKAGVLLATEGCLPSSKGARVRQTNGKHIVTDGPFTETKEIVGGFAILQVKSKDEVIEWNKRFLRVAGDGEVEVRELYEMPAADNLKC